MMGSNRYLDEQPIHPVHITRGFWISEVPITDAIVNQLMPSRTRSKDPVWSAVDITWVECCEFANRLSILEGYEPAYAIENDVVQWNRVSGGFRLPTEAEWEYAAKAGRNTVYSGSDTASNVAQTHETQRGQRPLAPSKNANDWNIHAMSGNVSEWCWDYFGTYSATPTVDPTGPHTGASRIYRGGTFRDSADDATCTYRTHSVEKRRHDTIGFRLVRYYECG
jgi:formylglycine-generating enzyme required for sulfatase activity